VVHGVAEELRLPVARGDMYRVVTLASAWTPTGPMTPSGLDATGLRSPRDAVVEAVRRLVPERDGNE
jgi:hypothetical protein